MIEIVEKIEETLNYRVGCQGMLVTDYDGTLLDSSGKLSEDNHEAFLLCKVKNYIRVIATGRSLFSLKRSTPLDSLPIDYIVFSSGAGILDLHSQKIVRKVAFEPYEVERVIELLQKLDLDFMVHFPIPENHRFCYHETGRLNPDFKRRCNLYQTYAISLNNHARPFGPSTQLLAIDPPGHNSVNYKIIKKELSKCTVLRTTSPLDGRSMWIEIFPENVAKSHTTAWLAARYKLDPDAVLAIGNDYNDQDLLEWAGTGCAVANAPSELLKRFIQVPSNNDSGVAWAVKDWLLQR